MIQIKSTISFITSFFLFHPVASNSVYFFVHHRLLLLILFWWKLLTSYTKYYLNFAPLVYPPYIIMRVVLSINFHLYIMLVSLLYTWMCVRKLYVSALIKTIAQMKSVLSFIHCCFCFGYTFLFFFFLFLYCCFDGAETTAIIVIACVLCILFISDWIEFWYSSRLDVYWIYCETRVL